MKHSIAGCLLFAAFLASSSALAQPDTPTPTPTPTPWYNFTYIDWNPGMTAAIEGGSSNRHYECRTVWDPYGAQFINIHEQDRNVTPYSYWITYSSDGRIWATPTPIDVPREWNTGHHAVAFNPDGFPTSDTMYRDSGVKFKMWYSKYGENNLFRYAESQDGISWTPAPTPQVYCPPYYKQSDFSAAGCGTTRIMIKPDVLYRPDGSSTLDTGNPMDNRYIMYLGSSNENSCSGNPGYFEMYISANGLDDWTLYAWDQQCADRWATAVATLYPPPTPTPTPEVYDQLTFTSCDDGQAFQNVDAIEEVYAGVVRQGFMFWTDTYANKIHSYYSTNGVDWTCNEPVINNIGTLNPTPGAWNHDRNYGFDSVRIGERYYITRNGSYNTGCAGVGNFDTPTPTPTGPTPTPTPTRTPTMTPTRTPTRTPTITPTGIPTGTPTVTPTQPPTPTPLNYVNMSLSPTTLKPGGIVGLSWNCDFARWNYLGQAVDIYLAAIKSPKVADAPSSISDALAGGEVWIFEEGMKKAYRFTGTVKKPCWSNVIFPPAPFSGTLSVKAPLSPAFQGDWIFATAFFRRSPAGPVRDDMPVENSNITVLGP